MARAIQGPRQGHPAAGVRGRLDLRQGGHGRVRVVFHTYSGFLAFVVQREYRFWADPDEARETLWRLHKHNCTRGLFAYGVLFIPLLSYGNYLAQKRSIRRQETSMAWRE